MKRITRIYKWIVISIVLQIALLSYFNFIYLPNRGTVRATMYEALDEKKENKELSIPEDAKDVIVSYNGNYAAYRQDNNIVIYEIKKNKKIKTLKTSEGEFSFFRWLPDRDLLIYSIKSPEGKNDEIQILTYEINGDLERNYPNIGDLPNESEVVDIELSPLTNVVYVKVKTSDIRARIYKYNINDKKTLIMTTGINTIIKETAYSDNLIYQKEKEDIKVRVGKNGSTKQFNVSGSYQLLSVDTDDNIYAGELNGDNRVVSIKYGKFDQEENKLKQVNLDFPTLPSDIFITTCGSIYYVTRQENCLYKLGNGKGISFEGELIEVLDDYLVSKSGDRLKLTVISD